jgi:hypothetical protein
MIKAVKPPNMMPTRIPLAILSRKIPATAPSAAPIKMQGMAISSLVIIEILGPLGVSLFSI